MTPFRVWAPYAHRGVELVLPARRVPLVALGRGWWGQEVALPPGTDYRVALDGGVPMPDPRSPWQPAGVHGPSRTVDHAAFRWTDDRWQAPPLAAGVIYELHVGTFSPAGTFDGAIAHLDHLVDLGVTHVELMPVAEFPGGRGWGYDGVDLFAPHHAYGGPDGLKRLVDACHARGLAVLLDVVYNHLGPDGAYATQFGPYVTDRHRTPWGGGVNVDGPGSHAVRRFFCDNAVQWLRDYHVDGLRLDAVHAIVDTSAVHLLEQLAETVDRLEASTGRHYVLVAESDLNDPRLLRPPAAGGYGIDAQWSDDVHHALHAVLTGERDGYYEDFGRLADVARALEHAWVYDGRFSPHRNRRHGRAATGLPGGAFVVFLQNHDQVGNRARGDRLAHLSSLARARVGAALLLTAPYVPLVFQGEEWAASSPFQYFTAHEDPQLADAVREGRRAEFAAFGWAPEDVPDPQSPETFARSRLDWDERTRPPHAAMLAWYRALLRLRRATPALRDGRRERLRMRFDEDAGWLVVERPPVTVAVNLGTAARLVPLAADAGIVLLASDPGAALASGGIRLPPDTAAIVGPASLQQTVRSG